jgi:hypothetical protein
MSSLHDAMHVVDTGSLSDIKKNMTVWDAWLLHVLLISHQTTTRFLQSRFNESMGFTRL